VFSNVTRLMPAQDLKYFPGNRKVFSGVIRILRLLGKFKDCSTFLILLNQFPLLRNRSQTKMGETPDTLQV
jgi:hypothetical protein